jgi:AraC-like DNA-binding protein
MPENDRLFRPARGTRWDLSSVDDAQLIERYRVGIADWYEASDFDPTRPFFTTNTVLRFENYVLSRGRSVGQILSRGQEEIRRSGLDSVAIILDLAGMKGDADGRDFDTPASTFHFRDLSRPSIAKVEAVDVIVLAMPRDAAPEWLVRRDFHGLTIESSQPLGRLLAGNLLALMEVAPQLSLEEGIGAIESALSLAQQSLIAMGHFSTPQTRDRNANLRTAAKAFINSRLADPGLSINDVLAAVGVSRATLFRAFAPSGGINLYIKNRRLRMAREALLNRVGHRPTIGEIAHAHGFISASHFSRAFKLRYSQSPGALRPIRGPATMLERSGSIRYDLLFEWIARSS